MCSTLLVVQRLFSMFPPGLPGLALLILRASVAAALLLNTYQHRNSVPGWIGILALVISLALSVGYLTPVAAAAALASHAALWFAFDATANVPVATTVFMLDALALALLGPGAYSIDARRFGRRLVMLSSQ